LNTVSFEQGDVDELTVEKVGGPHDIVFCLAIDQHVKDPERLYQLLGKICSGTLYFEGNERSDLGHIRSQLLTAGFAEVEDLGLSDDDCLESNNIRPLLRASHAG